MPTWRAMRPSDLPDAEALGGGYHIHHPERAEIYAERLRLAPDWCFVLTDLDADMLGYCVAHPWSGAMPPGLDTLLGALPVRPDCLHIHDLLLTAATRGRRLGQPLIDLLMARASRQGLPFVTLVAVGSAHRYWDGQGFSADTDPARRDFVARSYGTGAQPMRRALPIAGASSH